MKKLWALTVFSTLITVALTVFYTSAVVAANVVDTGERQTTLSGCSFKIVGEIQLGDAEKIRGFFDKYSFSQTGGSKQSIVGKNFVACLSGSGGDYPEAIRLTEVLIEKHILTSVPENQICADACAIAFLGGRDCCIEFGFPMIKRHLSSGSELRFTAPEIEVSDGKYTKSQTEAAFTEALDVISYLQRHQEQLKIDGTLVTKIVESTNKSYFSVKPDPRYRFNYVDPKGQVYQEIWDPSTNSRLKPVPIDSEEPKSAPLSPLKLTHFNSEFNIERVGTSNKIYLSNYSNEGRSAVIDPENKDVTFFKRPRLWHSKISSTHVSRDGKFLVSVTDFDGALVHVSSLETNKEIWRLNASSKEQLPTASTLSPDNTLLAASIIDHRLNSRRELFKIGLFRIGQQEPIGEFYGHNDHTTSLIFSKDGQRLVSSSLDGKTRVWDVGTQSLLFEFDGTSKGASYDAISPDGQYFVTASKRLKIWDLSTGDLVNELPYQADTAQFLPDGNKLLISTRINQGATLPAVIRILDLETNNILLEVKENKLLQPATVLPKSKQLVYSLIDEIKFIDVTHLLGE